MATNTTTPFTSVAEEWPKLEPAMTQPKSYTKNVQLLPSVSYDKGQVLCPHDTLDNIYVPPGHANAVAASRLFPLQYPCTTDASGNASLGLVAYANDTKLESVPIFITGPFFLRDLIGVTSDALLARLGSLLQGKGRTDTVAIVELGPTA